MDDERQMTDAKWWQKLTLPLARWAKRGAIKDLILIRLFSFLDLLNDEEINEHNLLPFICFRCCGSNIITILCSDTITVHVHTNG
jgi:hypothetical protein